MKKKTPPKNEKDKKPEGGAPPISPEKPKPVNDSKPIFSYYDMVFEELFVVSNRKFLRFFIDVPNPYYADMGYGEFSEYQLAVWEAKSKILDDSKEGEHICTCDSVAPEFEKLDPMSIHFKFKDEKTGEEIETEESIDVYVVWNLLENMKVGNICPTDIKKKK